jgi:hypothetical protein
MITKRNTKLIRISKDLATKIETDMPEFDWNTRVAFTYRTHKSVERANNLLFGNIGMDILKNATKKKQKR